MANLQLYHMFAFMSSAKSRFPRRFGAPISATLDRLEWLDAIELSKVVK
jgi:hypothetical protein